MNQPLNTSMVYQNHTLSPSIPFSAEDRLISFLIIMPPSCLPGRLCNHSLDLSNHRSAALTNMTICSTQTNHSIILYTISQNPTYHTSSKHTLGGVCILERPSCLTPSPLITSFSGPRKPSARKTSWAEKNFSDPGTSSIFQRPPLSFVHSTLTRIIHN